MESYAVACIPIAAVYVGWTIKMIMEAVKTNAATVAKLEMVVVEQSSQGDRIDALVLSRFGA